MLLFITAIHLTLYAKYKANDFTLYNSADDQAAEALQSFPNILFVSVRNVPIATVQFGDVAKAEKEKKDDITYVRSGDTLQISGNTNQEGFQRPVTLYVPANVTLSAFNSSLTFAPGNKTAQNNPSIYLQKSSAVFPGLKGAFQLGHLSIQAVDSSLVVFDENTQVNQLDLRLSNSSVQSIESRIGQLSIVTDSLSRISLPAHQLLKATIKNTTE